MAQSAVATVAASALSLRRAHAWRGIRVLAWNGDVLYGSRGYELVCWKAPSSHARRASDRQWKQVATFRPPWWRNLTSRSNLSYRLMRDGFHALAILSEPAGATGMEHTHRQFNANTFIAAVPGAILTCSAGGAEFRMTHKLLRGTRPLHITAVPSGSVYWGEYFDNRERSEVHIYSSADRGESWHVAYTFPAGAIRHVHNIVYDRWADCLWILTGDEGDECKVLCASCDLRSMEIIFAGRQQARAVAAIPMPDALYLSTDTPFEENHILRVDRSGGVHEIASLASSSIFGCRVGHVLFFSTMVEPSAQNQSREVHIVGSADQLDWRVLARWQKDSWPMRYFQYGNALLPDGENTTNFLAATTVAVEQDDLVTTLWDLE
ncbi:MAG: hypothetical protein WB817_08575 [Terriglobales bacterium]